MEIESFGAGLGGGFPNTENFKVMKYQKAVNGPDGESWKQPIGALFGGNGSESAALVRSWQAGDQLRWELEFESKMFLGPNGGELAVAENISGTWAATVLEVSAEGRARLHVELEDLGVDFAAEVPLSLEQQRS